MREIHLLKVLKKTFVVAGWGRSEMIDLHYQCTSSETCNILFRRKNTPVSYSSGNDSAVILKSYFSPNFALKFVCESVAGDRQIAREIAFGLVRHRLD